MSRFLRNNGLTVVLLLMFLSSLVGQTLSGHHEYNENQREHGQPAAALSEYLGSGHFIEAVFENWESEFLQMATYVFLTAFLFQKGSSESKDPAKTERVDIIPEAARRHPESPWAVRHGGLPLKLYQNSLGLAFVFLFLASVLLHAYGGAVEYNQDQLAHGGQAVSVLGYMGTSRFWFESFQNWQSEFFSTAVLVVLSIWLRQKGSPESKPVDAPHDETGGG
jgi:hypothetical protein